MVLRLILYISIALGFLATSPLDFGVVLHGGWKLPILARLRDDEGFELCTVGTLHIPSGLRVRGCGFSSAQDHLCPLGLGQALTCFGASLCQLYKLRLRGNSMRSLCTNAGF